MAINSNDCSPYLSGVLFRIEEASLADLISLRLEIQKLLRDNAAHSIGNSEKSRRFQTIVDDAGQEETFFWALLQYSETRRPPWCRNGDIKETRQHLITLGSFNDVLMLGFTDNAARNLVVRSIRTGGIEPFESLVPFKQQEIKRTLVESSVRTLWLSGIHRQSVVKPDSKTLSGIELEAAIDPLGDQSYYYSSIRSSVHGAGLTETDRPAIIGVSPKESRFWLSPTSSWDDFKTRSQSLLRHISQQLSDETGYAEILPMLAQVGGSLTDLHAPYDVAFVSPELQQAPDADESEENKWFQNFADTVRFDLDADQESADFTADVFWSETKLGRLRFEFNQNENAEPKLSISAEDWTEDESITELKNICTDPRYMNIYFDTGHTYSQGELYLTGFRDPSFNNWRWVEMGRDETEFGKEKPTQESGRGLNVAGIGLPDDKSLFGLVARHWPNLEVRGPQTGWLVCDDGSMESADFIHIDVDVVPACVSLIHVKGSGSKSENRGLSVSDYEVVVGQAVKNLRYLDAANLATKLRSSKDGVLKDAIWRDGERQQNRDELIGILDAIGTNIEKHVYVLQPRVRKAVWEEIHEKISNGDKLSSDVLRLKQLDTLLQNASANCYGLATSFTVIGDAS